MTNRKTELLHLATRVEHEQMTPALAERVFAAVHPQPEKGHWYWRSKEYSRWLTVEFFVNKALCGGDLLYALKWLYHGKVPELIHSDPNKAIGAALRAEAARL